MNKGSLRQFYEAMKKLPCEERKMFRKVLERILKYCKDCEGESVEKSIYCSACGQALAPYPHISNVVGFCMNKSCKLKGVLQYDYQT